MLKKRVKQLSSFYISIAIMVSIFGFLFNVNAKTYTNTILNKYEYIIDSNYINAGDIFVKTSADISNIHYYDNDDNLIITDSFDYEISEEYTIKSYKDIDKWYIANYEGYSGYLPEITLKPYNGILIDDVEDQNVKDTETANFKVNVRNPLEYTDYDWFALQPKVHYFNLSDQWEGTPSDESKKGNFIFYASSSRPTYYYTDVFSIDNNEASIEFDYKTNFSQPKSSFYVDIRRNSNSGSIGKMNSSGHYKSNNLNNGNYSLALTLYLYGDDTLEISNLKINYYEEVDLHSHNNTLNVSKSQNSKYFVNGNKFYVMAYDDSGEIPSNYAALKITGDDTFEDSNGNKIIVPTDSIDKSLSLIIKKTDKNSTIDKVVNKISNQNYIESFSASFVDNNKNVVDVGKGKYEIHYKLANDFNVKDLVVSKFDKDGNILEKEAITKVDNSVVFTTDTLGDFVITKYKPFTNPETFSFKNIFIILILFIVGTTSLVIIFQKYNKKKVESN